MAGTRPITFVAAVVFLIIAVVHVYRLMTHFQVVVGSHTVPQYFSWVGLVVAGGLSLMLFREARR